MEHKIHTKSKATHLFPDHLLPFDVFLAVTNFEALSKIKVEQSNLYAQQSGR